MTHDELLDIIAYDEGMEDSKKVYASLRAVVELHKPIKDEWIEYTTCKACRIDMDDHYSPKYPCQTIQAIEKELV